jgi:hypothetical protein
MPSRASIARVVLVSGLAAGLAGAHGTVGTAGGESSRSDETMPAPNSIPRPILHNSAIGPVSVENATQQYPYYEYDGTWRFVRIRTNGGGSGGMGGFGRRRGGGSGWAHDYPDADIHFSTILREITNVRTRALPSGGNVLTFDDPRLGQFPIAYVSEPDEWRVTEQEAAGLRAYLLKGGFVIFDDFYIEEMQNLVYQMSFVFPELTFLPLDGSEPIWDSFFFIDPLQVYLTGPNKQGTPRFYGLWVDNDKSKRMLAMANSGADIGDLWEWSANGFYPVDPTNEAFRIGVNYIIYAITH